MVVLLHLWVYLCRLFLLLNQLSRQQVEKRFSSSRSKFEGLSGHNFMIHWHSSEIPIVLKAQSVEQQGYEALDTGRYPNI